MVRLSPPKVPRCSHLFSNLFWLPRDLFERNVMSKGKRKNVVIHLTLFWFELQIKTQEKYHSPFLPAFQSSARCCKIVVTEVLIKFISFLQTNRTIDWDVHFSDKSWKDSKNLSLFFFQVARVLPEILKWFATPLLDIPFSSSFYVSYFTFKVTSWCSFLWPFYRVSQPQSNSNKFKDFKTFEYYDIRIETFELTTVSKDEKTRL